MANTHTAEFIQEMKTVLTEELEKLSKSLSRISHKRNGSSEYETSFPDYGDDEDENAIEISDYSNNLQVEAELEKALRDVKNALKRIEEGTYGICKYTGELINENRLRARPTSTSSIASKKTLTQEL